MFTTVNNIKENGIIMRTEKEILRSELIKSRNLNIVKKYEHLLLKGKSSFIAYDILAWEFGLTLDTIRCCIVKGRRERRKLASELYYL